MAQTLKFGNKVWAAKEDSVLAYNDINNNYKPLPFTFSRASIGTRVNKDGLIETMGQDIARIDYTDSADGVLLLEPQGTNSLLQSNQFDTTWTTSNTSVTGEQSGVGGSSDAWLLTKSAVAGAYIAQTISTSGVNTASVYVKAGTLDVITLWCNQVGGSNPFGTFNLTTQTLIDSGTIVDSNITSVGSGWYRVSITLSFNITLLRIYVNNFSDTTEGSIYIQNAQLEQSSYPTSYIPTSGSTVTRAAETCNNSGNSEVFNDSEGVFFVNTAALADDLTNRQISISDGGTSQRVYFGFRNNSNEFLLSSRDSSFIIDTVSDITNFNKYAFQYKSGNFKAFVNGFNYALDADGGLLPTGLNTLNFNDGANSADFYGKTKEIGYYDTVLTDLELETLTSYRNWVSMVNELNLNIIYNG